MGLDEVRLRLIRDLAGGVDGRVDDLELGVLDLEAGAAPADLRARLAGDLHAMKGEFGVLGLAELVGVHPADGPRGKPDPPLDVGEGGVGARPLREGRPGGQHQERRSGEQAHAPRREPGSRSTSRSDRAREVVRHVF